MMRSNFEIDLPKMSLPFSRLHPLNTRFKRQTLPEQQSLVTSHATILQSSGCLFPLRKMPPQLPEIIQISPVTVPQFSTSSQTSGLRLTMAITIALLFSRAQTLFQCLICGYLDNVRIQAMTCAKTIR